ncbi:MAG: hypothetical protein KF861_18775 [Planctomycetaceae bacterium]|nr:hypothetical protein [Planctomycetaceae bacterium]
MKHFLCWIVAAVACVSVASLAGAQEAGSNTLNPEALRESANDIVGDAREKVDEIAQQVDQSPQAKEVSAGILQPIYLLAESMAFPSFHWAAFTLMSAGVVSFALQLVLGKLVVLSKMSLNIKEILADGLGLLISLIGLVLTTQAAAENSTFTDSPASVLSAAGLGALLGLVFYWWGQTEEVQAAAGRKSRTKT